MQYWKPKDYEFSLCRLYLESEKVTEKCSIGSLRIMNFPYVECT